MHLSKTKNISGAVVTEMVIVMPVVLLLMAAIIQFSVFFVDKLHLNYAAYQAARGSCFNKYGQPEQYGVWKDAMPNAKIVPARGPDRFWLNSSQADIRIGIRLLNLEYESPVLVPILFEESEDIGGDQTLGLQAVGFTPTME